MSNLIINSLKYVPYIDTSNFTPPPSPLTFVLQSVMFVMKSFPHGRQAHVRVSGSLKLVWHVLLALNLSV